MKTLELVTSILLSDSYGYVRLKNKVKGKEVGLLSGLGYDLIIYADLFDKVRKHIDESKELI